MASMFNPEYNSSVEEKMHSPHRILVIKPMEGKKVNSSTGIVDTGLFKGTNSLHAIMEESGLWYLRYQNGVLPQPLKQRFTSLNKLLSFTRDYFNRRNLEITEVIDKHESFEQTLNPEQLH